MTTCINYVFYFSNKTKMNWIFAIKVTCFKMFCKNYLNTITDLLAKVLGYFLLFFRQFHFNFSKHFFVYFITKILRTSQNVVKNSFSCEFCVLVYCVIKIVYRFTTWILALSVDPNNTPTSYYVL